MEMSMQILNSAVAIAAVFLGGCSQTLSFVLVNQSSRPASIVFEQKSFTLQPGKQHVLPDRPLHNLEGKPFSYILSRERVRYGYRFDTKQFITSLKNKEGLGSGGIRIRFYFGLHDDGSVWLLDPKSRDKSPVASQPSQFPLLPETIE
jgi:hypothetical protein